MRHSKDDEYRELKREAKRQGIEVNSMKYNPFTNTQTTPEHKEQFAVVQSIGRAAIEGFVQIANEKTPERPWQIETVRRAKKLNRLAVKCRRENRNESGWRHAIEPTLFERFDIEVAW
jgi:hypothetical protein